MKKTPPYSPRGRSFPLKPRVPSNVYRRNAATLGRPGDDARHHCGIKRECGACQYVNLDYRKSLLEKHEAGLRVLNDAAVLSGTRVLPPTPSPRPHEYRCLFKLAVRPTQPHDERRFAIGLFAQGSHQVIDMDGCPLHAESLARLLPDLRAELETSSLTPYDEGQHSGDLRYIVARTAHLTGELMLTFVMTSLDHKAELRTMVANLQRLEHRINSAHINVNAERSNAIFGAETVKLAGADGLRERVLELDFEVGPTSFFQINPWQAINLYRRVEQIAGPAGREEAVAWDLYCGIGQMSLVLARLGYRVLGIEENTQAVADATESARRNRLSERTHFLAAKAEDGKAQRPPWASTPDLIVVNPSRRGLDQETREDLAAVLGQKKRGRLVYVSCDVTSLARDLRHLVDLTGFAVRQVESFDMFPQTDHMEWLVVLSA